LSIKDIFVTKTVSSFHSTQNVCSNPYYSSKICVVMKQYFDYTVKTYTVVFKVYVIKFTVSIP